MNSNDGGPILTATIRSTFLGVEDHGVFTYILNLDVSDSTGQGFGTYSLDSYDDTKERRTGTAYGAESIMQILDVVGVGKWEDLQGKNIRIQRESGAWSATITRIGHIIKDKWFCPRELAEQYITKEPTQ